MAGDISCSLARVLQNTFAFFLKTKSIHAGKRFTFFFFLIISLFHFL